jgi:CheY-like chemotaxis protein
VILVVEDDPQVARLIALVLQRRGEKVDVVADGTAAMERARTALPSLILADLTIKGMDGETLCANLKRFEETRAIPYVILSGDRDIAQKARHCGADDYLGKPFEFEDLLRLVDKYAKADS